MVDGIAKTPRYVLQDDSHPTCPSLLPTSPEAPAVVIYGFSDKPEYDIFLSASSLPLTPYPLVKGFLRNQIDLQSGTLKLVVLDAASATQRCIYAATFESVLKSILSGSEELAVSHRLLFDASSAGYRIEKSDVYGQQS